MRQIWLPPQQKQKLERSMLKQYYSLWWIYKQHILQICMILRPPMNKTNRPKSLCAILRFAFNWFLILLCLGQFCLCIIFNAVKNNATLVSGRLPKKPIQIHLKYTNTCWSFFTIFSESFLEFFYFCTWFCLYVYFKSKPVLEPQQFCTQNDMLHGGFGGKSENDNQMVNIPFPDVY